MHAPAFYLNTNLNHIHFCLDHRFNILEQVYLYFDVKLTLNILSKFLRRTCCFGGNLWVKKSLTMGMYNATSCRHLDVRAIKEINILVRYMQK